MLASIHLSKSPWLSVLCSLITLLWAACGTPSSRDRFETDIIPLLEKNCLAGTCHGVLPDAEVSGETINWEYFYIHIQEDGRIIDAAEAYKTTLSRINSVEQADFSSLLRKPLDPSTGGLHHLGGVQFRDRSASDYQILRDWISSEGGGKEGSEYAQLSDLQKQFATEVQPQLAQMQCMNQSCHGQFAPFSRFAQPLRIDGESLFSVAATKANYKTARIHLDFGTDTYNSRLLRKVLPLDAGGISHRGGNDMFFRSDDPGFAAIYSWAEAERREAMGTATIAEVSGVVFVRGPVEASSVFSHSKLVVGTDLYILEPPEPGGSLRNLTASAHAAPADIRDPAVNHDATKIAFAMRRSVQDAHNIYEIAVDGSGLRQLTFDQGALPGGGQASNVQPTYGPDGRIYFVSTRAGGLADSYDVLDTEIWAVDPQDQSLERLTFDPSPEVSPSFIGTGKNYGSLAYTMRRTINGRYQAPIFRSVLDHNKAYHADPEPHIHHGITIDEDIVYDMRTLHDGRYAAVLLNRDNQWRGGKLVIFDRQFGPEVPRGSEDDSAVGGFRHAFSTLDPTVAAGGVSVGGLYRHPVAMPNNDLLLTRSLSPLDLDDPDSTPELGLYLMGIQENRLSGEPSKGALQLLIDEPGIAEYDAEPIVVRPLEDDPSHEHAWDPTRQSATGTIAFRHVETLEAVFSNTTQLGPKPLRDDLVYARLLESLSVTPNEEAMGQSSATIAGRSQILGEIPLAGGSLYLEVPADRPFRVQFLNKDRMAVGTQQNRWNHVAPGEKFPGGVSPKLYPRLCAGCHGSLSGDIGEIGGPMPDIISAASMTMATHENLDPRRPLKPLVLPEPITVDYRSDVAPLVQRSCAVSSCHQGDAPAGALDLSNSDRFQGGYMALQPFVNSIESSAHKSYLMERILGRELGAGRRLTGACLGEPVLSSEEQLVFIRWIDMGATYRGVAP